MRAFLLITFCLCLLPAAATADIRASQPKSAASIPACSSALLACYSLSGVARGNCLEEASDASVCKSLELGRLAFKRFLIESGQPLTIQDSEEAHGFLGEPVLINTNCLGGFDNQFSGYLIKGEIDGKILKQLSAQLDECRRIEEPVDIFSP